MRSYSKKAFTMIELVFVIVILGILAVLAIPKLAATRDDTYKSVICANIATCVTDMAAIYTATNMVSLSDSIACSDAQIASSVVLNFSSKSLAVSNAPDFCPDMNGQYFFGGSRISL